MLPLAQTGSRNVELAESGSNRGGIEQSYTKTLGVNIWRLENRIAQYVLDSHNME